MCGRYYIAEDDMSEDLQKIIAILNRKPHAQELKTGGEFRPTDTVPVIANSRKLTPSVFAMKWGYTLPDGKLVFNARSETANEKAMFRYGMENRRCVVPASFYFEWERHTPLHTKYAIRAQENGATYMAGIYRLESDRPVFTILTRAPAESISFIHDRMPVILPDKLIRRWLDPRNLAEEFLQAADTNVRFSVYDA